MKNQANSIAAIFVLLLKFSIFAQAPWFTNGNIGVTGANFLGHNSAAPLQLRTFQPQPILFQTNGLNNKMLLSGTVNGFAGFGDNLPLNFNAQDRLHLHHNTVGDVRTRFSHVGTGSAAGDGSAIGIDATGNYCFTQFENSNTDFLTPRNVASSPAQVSRFEIAPNG